MGHAALMRGGSFAMSVACSVLLALLCLQSMTAWAGGRPRHVHADLVSAVTAVVPGRSFEVALRERIDPGWHTYWKNPGDAGAPTQIEWHLPAGFKAGPIQWPWPSRVPYGPLMDYGYHDQVVLTVKITAPASLAGKQTVLRAHVRWLVCSDICVPGQADVSLTLPVAGHASVNPATAAVFAKAREHIPHELKVSSTWQKAGKRIQLHIAMTGLTGARLESVDFFPDQSGVIDNAARQHFRAGADGLTLMLTGGKALTPQSSLAGVVVVTERRGQTQTSGFSIQPRFEPGAPAVTSGSHIGPWTAILFALLGGLILNLMPCVFPVLSMKVLALAEHRGAGLHVRLNGWVYAAGVIASFLTIAALLVALRAGGEQIGWGFQLQSPVVVAALVYLFFMIGLNLSGYFEAGTSLMGIGDGLASQPGITGSFFTGVLATVVAAPCTAPFMASAVGYALLVNNVFAFAIFAALGVGMAAPYVLLCYFPASVRLLPKPGPWMQTFREFMAFPMYGSAVWLIWVLAEEAGPRGVLSVLSGVLMLAGAVWLWRVGRRRPVIAALAVTLAAGALYLPAGLTGSHRASGPVANTVPPAGYTGPRWQPYSAKRLARLRAQGPVFVDFTAAWCITCKVNEAVALDSSRVKAAFAAKHVRYLRGDWTNQNPAITAALAKYGRSGVPLYLLFKPGHRQPEILPQILTESTVLQAIQSL